MLTAQAVLVGVWKKHWIVYKPECLRCKYFINTCDVKIFIKLFWRHETGEKLHEFWRGKNCLNNFDQLEYHFWSEIEDKFTV
jgi:hypothetical protein